ncbi:TlpA family protein disulfide reductase [Pseudomonadota bacterium]
MNRAVLIMALVAVVAASSGYFLARSLGAPGESVPMVEQTPSTDELLGTRRPDFSLRALDGSRFSATDLDGQIWLLNFWATWCKPCVEEMPMLSRLHGRGAGQGVNIVGIALDDEERARQFAQDLGVSYPILVGQTDVVLTGRRYGNSTGLLPFSVLIDADGVIRWTKLGVLDRAELEQQIEMLK